MEKTAAEHPYPFYQQFNWILKGSIHEWHSGVFVLDTGLIILVLGYLGLPYTLVKKPLIAGWIASYTLFLLIWMVKWPQYLLLLFIPLSISASLFITAVSRAIYAFFINIARDKYILLFAIALVIVINSLITASLYKESAWLNTRHYAESERPVVFSQQGVVFSSNRMVIVFDPRGLKPRKWSVDGLNLLSEVRRGDVLAVPHEWIPRSVVEWPGEIYYKLFDTFLLDNGVVGVAKLDRDAPNTILYKRVYWLNDTSFRVVYRLYNSGSEALVVGSDPITGVDWGFSVDLTLSPGSVDGVYQYVRFCNSTEVYTQLNWVSWTAECVVEYGLHDRVNGFKVSIYNHNASSTSTIWFERSREWVTIRLSYTRAYLKPGESITYVLDWTVHTKSALTPPHTYVDPRVKAITEYLLLVCTAFFINFTRKIIEY